MDDAAEVGKGSHDQHTPMREPEQVSSLCREGIISSEEVSSADVQCFVGGTVIIVARPDR